MPVGEILVVLLMLATLAALVAGVVLMSVGGKANIKYGNRLMVARVTLQGAVLLMLLLIFMVGSK